MAELVFVDTNVLIYARDRKSADKREICRSWLAELVQRQSARLNMQVLNEFTRWVLANEPARALPDVRAEVEALREWGDRAVDQEDQALAWKVRASLGYQWFDCLLLAAAENSGCRFFLTEDMADRARFRSITLINPFRASPSEIFQQH
jgi:predicted nucleic acid-binding protein